MTQTSRPTWTLLPNEDFACEAFIDAGNVVVHITIIPRLRAEQLAHYASEGLRHVEADYQDFCRRFNYSPYSEVAIRRFQEFQAWEDLDDEDDDCLGHESTSGPIGNVVYCDGTCR